MGFKFQLVAQIRCAAPPSAICVGSDERTAVAVCDDKLVRMDLVEGSQVELCTLPDPVSELSLDAAHQLIAVAAGTADVAIYDLRSGGLVQTVSREGAPGSLRTVPANHIAVAPDGKMLVTTTTGSRIFVSNIGTGQWEHIMFVKYDGCDVAISPNGKYVALFGAPKASEISGHLTMFLVRHGLQPLSTRWHESDNAITWAKFSPDSKSVITCGAGDGVRVWDVRSGELQWHRTVLDDSKFRAAWSFGESDFLATLGAEMMVFEKGNDDPVFRLKMQHSSLTELSPSGKLLLMLEDREMISVWKMSEPE